MPVILSRRLGWPERLGHKLSESERMTMSERALSLPSARLTDLLPPEIRYEVDRRIAAAALTQMLKGWQVPRPERMRSFWTNSTSFVLKPFWIDSRVPYKVYLGVRYKDFILRILERLDMPAHELEPKPKRKLPLWAEALDLLQSESARELLGDYRLLAERDNDGRPILAELERWYGSEYRSSARATMHAARAFWLDALLGELERLYGTKWSNVYFSC